jgi:CubicO group peptidase (beta-lactamase class C family)
MDPSKQRSPIVAFRNGFTPEQSKYFKSRMDLSCLFGSGDNAVWFCLRSSDALPTDILPVRQPTRELSTAPHAGIGKIRARTKHFGNLSLDEFLKHPQSFAQAFMVVYRGQVLYENYPGIRPEDPHIWMSVSKPIAGLVMELLISDGRIDPLNSIGFYLPEFRGTAWEDIKVLDVLDMTAGIDVEENDQTRSDPDSNAIRAFLAELGLPHRGKTETLLEVLQQAEKQNPAGMKFEYASPGTEVLVLLAEAVSGQRWAEFVDKRIWSKVGMEGPLLVHTSPDGIALAHGFIASRLRDLARFGMLYTPSWNKVASEPVVTPEIIQRIQKGIRSREFYRRGFDGPVFIDRLNDDSMTGNSRHWDAVWEDGDFWKCGIQSQGLYVSPARDLVMAFFSVNFQDDSIHRYLRPIATSPIFENLNSDSVAIY